MLSVRLLAVAAVIAFFGCAANPPPPAAPPPTPAPKPAPPPKETSPTESAGYQRAMGSTIALLDSRIRGVICAGQFVSPNIVVTAYHCIDTATGIAEDAGDPYEGAPVAFVTRANWLNSGDEKPVSLGVVWRIAPEHDLALIVSNDRSPVFVPLGPEPWPSARVFAIGHPDGDVFRLSAGMVTTSLFPISGKLTTAAIIYLDHGSSGGGLYDSEWRLVGVTSMGWLPVVGFFIPAMYVRGLMDD